MTDSEKRSPVHCIMLGVGGRPFINDWAAAASLVATVSGAGRNADSSTVPPDVPIYPLERAKKARPSRIFSRYNTTRHTKAIIAAARQASRDRGPIDLIHSHFASGSAGVPAAAKALGIPFIHTEHSSSFVDPARPPSSLGLKTATRIYGAASRVFFVSESLLRAVQSRGLEGRFEVLHNPVNNLLFHPRPRAGPGLSIVTVGNLLPRKRHDLFIRSLPSVFEQYPEARARLIGDGPELGRLRTLADQLRVADRLTFDGSLPRVEVARLLAASDVYVHTATAETFGVSIVEALLSGLPVVTTDCGGVVDSTPNDLGVTVVEADPVALGRAIIQAIGRDSETERKRRARGAALLWGLESVAPRLERAYREALQTK